MLLRSAYPAQTACKVLRLCGPLRRTWFPGGRRHVIDDACPRTVIACCNLLMPTAVAILVRNRRGHARHALFAGGPLRCPEGVLVRGKRFGEHAVRLVGPATIVLDDRITKITH